MKKIVLLLTLNIFCFNSYSQKIYHNKFEYDKAMSQYNDELESYENYINKINFYKKLKCPKKIYYELGSDFIKKIVPLMLENGIKLDNTTTRLHPNVKTRGITYFYYFDQPNKDYFTIWISSRDTVGYVHASETCSFNHPGKPPVYVENIKPKKEIVIKRVEPIKEKKVTEPVKFSPYIMPNGEKYHTLDELIKVYPMMKNEKIFSHYFKKIK